MNRRNLIQAMAGGAAVNLAGLFSQSPLQAQPGPQETQARRGLPPLKITNVKAILTAPWCVPSSQRFSKDAALWTRGSSCEARLGCPSR